MDANRNFMKERAAAGLPVPAPGAARAHLPRALGGGLTRAVGQPLHPAQPGERLSRPPAPDAPHHPEGRSAALAARLTRRGWRRS